MSPSRRTEQRRSAPVPAVGSVSVKATTPSPLTAGSTKRSRCSGVANWSTARQTPLATWTIMRSDACDMEKSSRSSSQRENGIPRPPYSSGAAIER